MHSHHPFSFTLICTLLPPIPWFLYILHSLKTHNHPNPTSALKTEAQSSRD
jgi:hypothetical protein